MKTYIGIQGLLVAVDGSKYDANNYSNSDPCNITVVAPVKVGVYLGTSNTSDMK